MTKYWDKRLRDKNIVRLYEQKIASIDELTRIFKVSKRTIQRVLKQYL